MARPATPMAERFEARVDRDGPTARNRPDLGPCWLWRGRHHANGYVTVRVGGRLENGGRDVLLHRWAYEHFIGPIGSAELDHFACDNRACVNPYHCRPTGHQENVLRGDTVAAQNKAKTRCPHGHPYTPENTYVDPSGSRHCRECGRAVMRAQYHRRSGAAAVGSAALPLEGDPD